MDEHEGQPLRNQELMFFGRVMAGQSHEVTNVFNIINELAGLQADILQTANRGRYLDLEKLRATTEKIQLQVQRGESIIRSLNRFAHTVDAPIAIFDLREVMDRVIYLAQRQAHLARAVLDAQFPKESISLETSLFGFEQAVLTCIEIAVAASSEQKCVTVSYRVVDGGGEISITSADPVQSEPGVIEKQRSLELLMRELGGKVEAFPDVDKPHRFTLSFRSRLPT